jgi:hypothetical protein
MQPEKLSEQSLNSVSFYCVPHLFADRDAQSTQS